MSEKPNHLLQYTVLTILALILFAAIINTAKEQMIVERTQKSTGLKAIRDSTALRYASNPTFIPSNSFWLVKSAVPDIFPWKTNRLVVMQQVSAPTQGKLWRTIGANRFFEINRGFERGCIYKAVVSGTNVTFEFSDITAFADTSAPPELKIPKTPKPKNQRGVVL